MVRNIFREVGLLLAFIILGALLLLTIWLSQNFQNQIAKEFKQDQISLILKAEHAELFERKLKSQSFVEKVTVFSASQNKQKTQGLYPELRSVLEPVESNLFPTSAIVSVNDLAAFETWISGESDLYESKIVHSPPLKLKVFMQVLSGIFLALWILTLGVVIYFNLERISTQEEAKWSLMKMLGARSDRIFLQLWYGQATRIGLACLFAGLVFFVLSVQIRQVFPWGWGGMGVLWWGGFMVLSLALTSVLSYYFFRSKYQGLSLG